VDESELSLDALFQRCVFRKVGCVSQRICRILITPEPPVGLTQMEQVFRDIGLGFDH
jgi:hypothetical protein